MKVRILLLLAASGLLLAVAGWYGYRAMNAAPSAPPVQVPAPPMQRVQTVNGETVVIVGVDTQRASHIAVEPVAVSQHQSEITAYGAVIDLQPLFDLRNRYAAAHADREGVRAQADASRTQYERNRVLFQDDQNVSRKSLQDAQTVMQTDQAKLQATGAALSALNATLRQQFGDALATAAISPVSDLSQRLLAGRAVVLRITLPADNMAAAPTQIIVDGIDGHAIPAQKLSPSPQSDPAVQGNPYFYMADSALPVGMRTTAHVSLGGKSTPGLLIPENAVVWYGGQPWVYVKTATDHFTRRYVPSESAANHGYVVTSGFRAGDEVVIRGAQLLLSEELRPQGVASQQCKDPPECDD